MLRELTDKELVKRYQQGEIRGYEELVKRHYLRIFRLALVYLIDQTNASDVTQEVFGRAVKGLKAFLFRAEPGTWLYKTTRNVCQEFNRKTRISSDEIPETCSISMEEQAEHAQTAAQIRALIHTLPERQKEVVVLRVLEDLSIQETAKLMKVREGTVKANLHKALAALRNKLQASEYSGECHDEK